MKKLFLGILFACCCFVTVTAQQKTTLQVFLKTAKNDSAGNITLRLYSLPDTILISTQVSVNKGNVFNIPRFSKYILRTSSVEFESAEKLIAISDKPVSIAMTLTKRSTTLKDVVVVSRKPVIKQEDDKTIVDAEVLANSSTNAYEVLEKTPGAVVDQDGNVYLNSSTPAMIQVNGREVKLSAADLSSLLKSLPAGSISKIEILRNPSAKYDAASTGGILNIVLKKGIKLGSSGSMNVGSFQGVYNTRFAGFNLNKSDDKVSTYLSYQYTERDNYEEIISSRIIPTDNTSLSQRSYSTYPTINHYGGAGIDLSLTKKFSISYDLRLTGNINNAKTDNNISIISNANQAVVGSNESIISNTGKSSYIGNDLSTRFKIDSAGSEWTSSFTYNIYRYNNNQLYNNYYYNPAATALLGDGTGSNRKNNFAAQTDLVLKLKKKFTVETGFKTNMSTSRNAADYFYQQGNSGRIQDKFQTNTFRYREAITSAYLQLAKTFAGFTLKPGLRMESTDIKGRQLIPKDTSLSIQRTDLFPYVYLRHRIMKLFGFELMGNGIYRRSITRPYYESLNPYPKYVDQYLYDVGNPSLRPQFTTNYEFNVMADDFPVFSVGVNKTKDIFSNVTYQDNVTKIAYRTYDNLGSNKEIYLRLVGGIPPGGKYFFYLGAQYNHNEYEGVYQNKPLAYKRGSWTFFTYQNIKVTPKLNISINGFMRTKGLQNFYELKNFGQLNISINKKILDGKGNLILSGNDILRTNKYDFSLQQGTVNAFGSRVNDTRRIGLVFRYNFGIKPKEEKKQTFEQPTENN